MKVSSSTRCLYSHLYPTSIQYKAKTEKLYQFVSHNTTHIHHWRDRCFWCCCWMMAINIQKKYETISLDGLRGSVIWHHFVCKFRPVVKGIHNRHLIVMIIFVKLKISRTRVVLEKKKSLIVADFTNRQTVSKGAHTYLLFFCLNAFCGYIASFFVMCVDADCSRFACGFLW